MDSDLARVVQILTLERSMGRGQIYWSIEGNFLIECKERSVDIVGDYRRSSRALKVRLLYCFPRGLVQVFGWSTVVVLGWRNSGVHDRRNFEFSVGAKFKPSICARI